MSTATALPATPDAAAGTLPLDWSSDWSVADLQQHLGGIPAERIRLVPAPGYATEQDLLDIADREDRLYELEDGGRTLPRFQISLRELFDRAGRQGPSPPD